MAGNLERLLKGTDWPLFPFLAALALCAGVLLLVLTPWFNRMMGLKKTSA